jgi:hypothetical protein
LFQADINKPIRRNLKRNRIIFQKLDPLVFFEKDGFPLAVCQFQGGLIVKNVVDVFVDFPAEELAERAIEVEQEDEPIQARIEIGGVA